MTCSFRKKIHFEVLTGAWLHTPLWIIVQASPLLFWEWKESLNYDKDSHPKRRSFLNVCPALQRTFFSCAAWSHSITSRKYHMKLKDICVAACYLMWILILCFFYPPTQIKFDPARPVNLISMWFNCLWSTALFPKLFPGNPGQPQVESV